MLIKTKLDLPPLRARMLDREHLVEKLSAAATSRLILITGQAGSGKTSLACQWIRRRELHVLWYSLDKTDNEGDIFFRYLLTAFSNKDKLLAEALRPFLQGRKRLTGEETLPFLIEHVANLAEQTYLVLDDYHLITSGEIHNALSYLLQHMPPTLHIVLMTRHQPPFSLARLRVSDQMVEISGLELRFTEKEGERFFSEIMPVGLTAEQMQELTSYAEGWIGGMQLIGLSLRERHGLEGLGDILHRARRLTAEYLIDEIVHVQPERVRDFIRATVLLNRFNADLCTSITGIEETQEILDYLQRINLFLIPLDAGHEWYRYHHLFSEAMAARIKIEWPQGAVHVHRKAALWFAQHHFLEDAFQHAFASQDFQFAADLLEDYLYLFFEGYAIASVQRWLLRLPQEVFMQHPLLRLDECSFKILSQELAYVEAVVEDIEGTKEESSRRYGGFKKTRFHNTLTYLKHTLPYFEDPATVDVDRLKRGTLEVSKNDHLLGGAIELTVALSQLYKGNLSEAETTLRGIRHVIFLSQSIFRRMLWFKSFADVERGQGHLSRSEATIKQAFLFLDHHEHHDSPLRFFLYLPLAWISYLRNDLDGALEHATTSSRYAEQAGFISEIIGSNFLLSMISLARGESEKIDLCMGRLQSASSAGASGSTALGDAYTALISVMRGDLKFAAQWADRRRPGIEEVFSVRLVFECLAYTRLLYEQGRYDEALPILEYVRQKCLIRNMRDALLQVDLLYCATLNALGDRDQARSVMEQALTFSETEGYVRPFADCWPLVSPMLTSMARSFSLRKDLPHLATILNACGSAEGLTSISKRMSGNGTAGLTRREMEILKLIAAGYRKREIAEMAFISLDTVKTHTRHIFEKLEARTKIEAIRRAREVNLLE
jgi:LuxR family maltose regulon positive regulatory protein